MSAIVPIIVILIILAQVYFFRKNVKRMNEYRRIFEKEGSWGIVHNAETGFVSGIKGEGNTVFESIKDSINKYLGNNSGSVIDFQLLKDAVDRHCDSVENDVNTLTPIPLYCGLAGTMAGVIIGLSSLIYTGSITDLLSSGAGNFGAAANGVNDLLSGVAWAMIASICGIIFTTWGSILFKSRKIQGEAGKNTFLAWLQAKLLPELPSDTSDALNRLVKNLNQFNDTFYNNTTELRGALREVNQSYRIQADVIKTVHDMDVMKMAKANVQVLKELEACTDRLVDFNSYLDDIHGYTDAIHRFTSQFESEANRLHVLEEIRDFFNRHRAEIYKETADVDVLLRDAFATMKEAASNNSEELNKTLTQQAETFKNIVLQEKATFEELSEDLKTRFSTEISEIPLLQEKLSEISDIPNKLDKLIDRIEASNASLASNVSTTLEQVARRQMQSPVVRTGNTFGSSSNGVPGWMKWTVVVSAIVIALACLTNTVHNIWFTNENSTNTELYDDCETTDSIAKSDSVVVDTASHKVPIVSNHP